MLQPPPRPLAERSWAKVFGGQRLAQVVGVAQLFGVSIQQLFELALPVDDTTSTSSFSPAIRRLRQRFEVGAPPRVRSEGVQDELQLLAEMGRRVEQRVERSRAPKALGWVRTEYSNLFGWYLRQERSISLERFLEAIAFCETHPTPFVREVLAPELIRQRIGEG